MTQSPVDGRHGLGRVEFIALMGLISTTIAASIDTILPAFDEMEVAFGKTVGDSNISLSITVFLAAMGIGMLVWGPLADAYGRKPIMLASLTGISWWRKAKLFSWGAVAPKLMK